MDNEAIFAQLVSDEFERRTAELTDGIDLTQQHAFSRRHEKKMRRLIKRQRKPYFRFICTASRRAVCTVAAIVIVCAAAMSVKAVRETVFDFVTSVFSDHQVISADTDSDEGYPKTIEQEYRITSLPDGYKQVYCHKTETMVDIPYYSADSRILFSQHTKDSFSIIFTDNAKIEDCTDNDGQRYQVVITEHETAYIWDNGRYVFIITGSLDRDRMIAICKSVKPVTGAHKTQ